jgi:hypothetical protein
MVGTVSSSHLGGSRCNCETCQELAIRNGRNPTETEAYRFGCVCSACRKVQVESEQKFRIGCGCDSCTNLRIRTEWQRTHAPVEIYAGFLVFVLLATAIFFVLIPVDAILIRSIVSGIFFICYPVIGKYSIEFCNRLYLSAFPFVISIPSRNLLILGAGLWPLVLPASLIAFVPVFIINRIMKPTPRLP